MNRLCSVTGCLWDIQALTHFESPVLAEMELGVHKGTIILEPLEGVAGVTVHMMVTIRGSAVRKEDHDLVNGLWVLGKVVLNEEKNSVSMGGSLKKDQITQNMSGSFKWD